MAPHFDVGLFFVQSAANVLSSAGDTLPFSESGTIRQKRSADVATPKNTLLVFSFFFFSASPLLRLRTGERE